jgi:serine/threonine protein kinase
VIAADARSGSTVGKYRLHEIVGRGGMGVVYRAEHVYIGREVAVKILHEGYGSREEAIKRFLREARAASSINHPNIVDVTDFGKASDGTVFFVMELLVGEPLDTVLVRDRRLDLLRAINICNQLAAALAAAHNKGIIHRDLKPENVMLIEREGRRELVRRVTDESGPHEIPERETKFDFVKILDFGVAKVREPEAERGAPTQAGVVFGTPEYMAPETARIGYSDARSDIYALGIMFYEMLTGTVPFRGDEAIDVMLKQVNAPVPPMSEVAPKAEITSEAERLILKALSKDPDLRQQSMEEFHRELQRCYGQLRFRRTLQTPGAGAGAPAAAGSAGAEAPGAADPSAAAPSPSASSASPPPPRSPSSAASSPFPSPGVTPGTEASWDGPTGRAAIPLTRLKRAPPGALPTRLAVPGLDSRELVLDGSAWTAFKELASTPRRPSQPILLTRKKAPRDHGAAEPTVTVVAVPGALPTEMAFAPSSARIIPPDSTLVPAESRKRTTLPLPTAPASPLPPIGPGTTGHAPAPEAAPPPPATTRPTVRSAPSSSDRPPATPPLPLWGTDMHAPVHAPPPASSPAKRTAEGPMPGETVSDRATPRVEVDLHLAGSSSPDTQAQQPQHPQHPRPTPPQSHPGAAAEERPPWFDGPTVVRNPLSIASLRDLKPQNDS